MIPLLLLLLAGPCRADAVLRWNRAALDAAAAAPEAEKARALALVHAAVFDAVNAAAPGREGVFREAPKRARFVSPAAAVAAAAHGVLSARFPERRKTLDLLLKESLASLPEGAEKAAGLEEGAAAAAAALAAPAGPFCLARADELRPGPPPAASTAAVPTAEGLDAARFWDASPAERWNAIASSAAAGRGLPLPEGAALLALTNLALADALLAAEDAAAFHASTSYPSADAAAGGAAAAALAGALGRDDLPFAAEAPGERPRAFGRFSQAAEEAALAEVHAGSATRAAAETGLALGLAAGRLCAERRLKTLDLPSPGPSGVTPAAAEAKKEAETAPKAAAAAGGRGGGGGGAGGGAAGAGGAGDVQSAGGSSAGAAPADAAAAAAPAAAPAPAIEAGAPASTAAVAALAPPPEVKPSTGTSATASPAGASVPVPAPSAPETPAAAPPAVSTAAAPAPAVAAAAPPDQTPVVVPAKAAAAPPGAAASASPAPDGAPPAASAAGPAPASGAYAREGRDRDNFAPSAAPPESAEPRRRLAGSRPRESRRSGGLTLLLAFSGASLAVLGAAGSGRRR